MQPLCYMSSEIQYMHLKIQYENDQCLMLIHGIIIQPMHQALWIHVFWGTCIPLILGGFLLIYRFKPLFH